MSSCGITFGWHRNSGKLMRHSVEGACGAVAVSQGGTQPARCAQVKCHQSSACLVFGHTAVVTVQRAPELVPSPDYLRVFVTWLPSGPKPPERVIQTGVSLTDVLTGLASDDVRLRDAVLAAVRTD